MKQAAVLLMLYPVAGLPHLVFTRRTELVADHKSEISFPGGSIDPEDSSPLAAALRETREELGVEPSVLRVLGDLEPVDTVVTNYLITPFLAYTPVRPRFQPAPLEVAEVIEVPVPALLDPSVLTVEHWDSDGMPRDVYFYRYGEHVIWGATGRILKQFLDRRYSEAWWRTVCAPGS